MGLKDIVFPFNPDSEEEVRVALAAYFQELGFSSTEMSFEDYFNIKLGHTNVQISKASGASGRKTESVGGRSDMLLIIEQEPFAIVEIKACTIPLTDEDRDQGLSYARLLRKIPPFTILTNGDELKIYDTITTTLLDLGTPEFARDWKNRVTSSINEQERKRAARTLLSLNFEVLQSYCRKQIERELTDLKGNPEEGKRYSPTLYLTRGSIENILPDFLNSSCLCLAFVGDSGIGKTNVMCSLAESVKDSETQLALFYRAVNLSNGLKAAIQNDFEWEFERSDIPTRVISRFAELASGHQTQLIIFIDGLDEYPEDLKTIKNELVDLAKRLPPDSIRLCLSCKASDWSFFIQDRGESLNSLGKSVFTAENDYLINRLPGVWLNLFNDEELNAAWEKYKQVFNLPGSLSGETQQESKMPLFLRFIAEVYNNQITSIPPNLTDKSIFEHYWQRKMKNFNSQQKLMLNKIVCKAAEEMIVKDKVILEESIFFNNLDSSLAHNPLYEDIFRFGFLLRQNLDGNSHIIFPFEKLRSYVYCMNARQWPTIIDPQKVKEETLLILDKRLGQDALMLYLDITNGQSNKGWLSYVIENDFNLFLDVINKFEGWKLQNIPTYTTFEPYKNQHWLENFDKAYTKLLSRFPAAKEWGRFNSEGKIGILAYIKPNKSFSYGFRRTNDEFQNQFLLLSAEGYKYWEQIETRVSFVKRFTFNGVMTTTYGGNPFLSNPLLKFPETAAWKCLKRRLENLLSQQLFDESNNTPILAERIYQLLRFEPCWWPISDRIPRSRFFALLGFNSIQELTTVSFADIQERTRNLYKQFNACSQSPDNNTHDQRWYKQGSESLLILLWFIYQLQQCSQNLPPITQIEPLTESFDCTDAAFLQIIPEINRQLAPIVIESFALLTAINMPRCFNFTTFPTTIGRTILEISCPNTSDFVSSINGIEIRTQNPQTADDDHINRGHYIYISYIWLPSAPTGSPIVRTTSWEDSIAEQFITDKKSIGNIFAKNIEIETLIEGSLVKEQHTVISRIRYDKLGIISQVYQLFTNEAAWLLNLQINGELTSFNKTETLSKIEVSDISSFLQP